VVICHHVRKRAQVAKHSRETAEVKLQTSDIFWTQDGATGQESTKLCVQRTEIQNPAGNNEA